MVSSFAANVADVLVERTRGDASSEVGSILLPTAGGPHAELAGEVTRVIALAEGATVRVIHAVPPGSNEARREQAETVLRETIERVGPDDIEVESAILGDADTASSIVRETEGVDLTVIGATQEGLLQELVLGAIPVSACERAAGTVIMTKRNLGITSRLRRWLRWV